MHRRAFDSKDQFDICWKGTPFPLPSVQVGVQGAGLKVSCLPAHPPHPFPLLALAKPPNLGIILET